MDKSAIRASIPPTAPAAALEPSAKPAAGRWSVKKVLRTVASLRLTVILFALSIFLVFAGTLAQADEGIWTVVGKYFRSALVWIPVQVFIPNKLQLKIPGAFPYPGGWLLGGILLVNLLAAHALWLVTMLTAPGFRFMMLVKRSGIILLHAGIIVMMLGELIAGLYQVEGYLSIEEGRWANFLEHRMYTELAVIRPTPEGDKVVAVPASFLQKDGTLRDERLPFDVEVVKYMKNSAAPVEAPADAAPGSARNPATAGDGRTYVTAEANEAPGTDSSSDLASAYVTFRDKASGASLGTYLLSTWFSGVLPDADLPQRVTCDGQKYDVYLRFKRSYKPYSVYLYKFEHDKYLGTDTPKNYASRIRLLDKGEDEDREAYISMNSPLRYRGETFFQADFFKDGRRGTVLQVVRNPGWLLPYVSCGIVAAGMLIHFGISLVGFLARRAKP